MTQWDKLLKSLGFTDSESKIYLTSLEMGAASVQDIARKARVSRVTTYAVIESLTKHGLMSSVEKGKKKNYVAEAPERLVSFVQNRVKVMEATLREMESSLHDLKLIQRGEKPVVKMFEGREALMVIQEDILRTAPKEYDEFGNFDIIHTVYTREELEPFKENLKRLKVKRRGIFLAKNISPHVSSEYEIIVLPPENYNFDGDIIIYDNKVALSTFHGKQISVLIESEELADTMKAFFDHVWFCAGGSVKK